MNELISAPSKQCTSTIENISPFQCRTHFLDCEHVAALANEAIAAIARILGQRDLIGRGRAIDLLDRMIRPNLGAKSNIIKTCITDQFAVLINGGHDAVAEREDAHKVRDRIGERSCLFVALLTHR